MQPASRPEASWPSALPARSIHVTPIGSRGWSVSILVSPRQLATFNLHGTLPAYLPSSAHLLVSLGSAPGSRVARPRRNTATFASPPWLLLHGQWHISSSGLGADKRLYAIAAMSERMDNTQPVRPVPCYVRFRRVDSTRLGSTQFELESSRLERGCSSRPVLPTAVADLPNFQVCFTVDPGRTATPSVHQADGVAALPIASQTIARVHNVN